MEVYSLITKYLPSVSALLGQSSLTFVDSAEPFERDQPGKVVFNLKCNLGTCWFMLPPLKSPLMPPIFFTTCTGDRWCDCDLTHMIPNLCKLGILLQQLLHFLFKHPGPSSHPSHLTKKWNSVEKWVRLGELTLPGSRLNFLLPSASSSSWPKKVQF